MSSNNQILLRELLERQRQEIAPELDESEFFEIFVMEQVLKDHALSYPELEEGITDGSLDGGIDALYVFVNGRVVEEDTDLSIYRTDVVIDVIIAQAKRETGFSERVLERLASTLAELLQLDALLAQLHPTYNEHLLERIAILHRVVRELADRSPRMRFSASYATVADEVHPNTARKAELVTNAITAHFPAARADVRFLTAGEILALARSRASETVRLRIAEGPLSSGAIGYVCLVTLTDFFQFLRLPSGELHEAIFESNVRDYQGSTEVNEAIRRSLDESGAEDFWWLNNGVTIVCTEANLAGKEFTLRDPQVVNGLQSSREIFDYLQERDEQAPDDRTILIRIIVPQDESSRNKIIRATNSQNQIPTASLRATDNIHRNIESYFLERGLYYDRRKNFYKNQGKPRDKIVTIPYLGQAVAAIILQRPNDARARPSSLLKSEEDYRNIFSEHYPLGASYSSVQLMRRVEDYLRRTDIGLPKSEKNDLKFHIAAFAACIVVQRARPTAAQIAAAPLEDLDDGSIHQAVEEVIALAQAVGGQSEEPDMDRVAKSAELRDRLVARLNELFSPRREG